MALLGMQYDDSSEIIAQVKTETNLVSITRVATEVTTGNSGNIAIPYSNDGLTYITGALVLNQNVYLRPWVSGSSNMWFLTAVDPNTGATKNNTQMAIRYLVMTIKAI